MLKLSKRGRVFPRLQLSRFQRFKSSDSSNDNLSDNKNNNVEVNESNNADTSEENGDTLTKVLLNPLEDAPPVSSSSQTPGSQETQKGASSESTSPSSTHSASAPETASKSKGGSFFGSTPLILAPHIQEALEKVNLMTHKELQTQKFLDGGRPFLSTKADGFLLRKNLIRDLPEKIELFDEDVTKGEVVEVSNTQPAESQDDSNASGSYPADTVEDINRIYSELNLLDRDEVVHRKYFEKYGISQNETNDIIQGFNGINDKFQSLRRGETLSLTLSPNHFRFEPNMFNMPYNVPGFDVSFTGIPLRFGKQKYLKRKLPVELVKDFRMYNKTVPIFKRDLDFDTQRDQLEKEGDEETSTTIHPEIDTLSLVNKVKLMEKDCIHIEDKPLSSYNSFPYDVTSSRTIGHNDSLEMSITWLQRRYVKDIEDVLGGMYKSPDSIFKPNSFYLYEKKKPKILCLWNKNGATEISLPIQLAKLSTFPLSTYMIKTRKERRFLRLHLFKIFMINIESLLDRLITMKYHTEEQKNAFLDSVVKKVYKEIDNRILDEVIRDFNISESKIQSRARSGNKIGAIMYKPFENGSFKRIIWTRHGWGALKHHQRSKLPTVQVKRVNLEDVIKL